MKARRSLVVGMSCCRRERGDRGAVRRGGRAGAGAPQGAAGAGAGRRAWCRAGGQPAAVADGRRLADGFGSHHRPRTRLRIGAVAGARSRPGHLQVRSARIPHFWNRQRPAVQDPPRRATAFERRVVQRTRADRADAPERLRPHVRVHLDLHDVLGTCRRRGRHRRSAAGDRRESPALRGTVGRTGTGQRDPGAGRCADQSETVHRTDGRVAGPQGHSRRHVGDGGNA